jgi:hypothetical protein
MSHTKQVTLRCDNCDCWVQMTGILADVRKHYKQEGWTCFRENDRTFDYCSKCSTERKERLEAEQRLKRPKEVA